MTENVSKMKVNKTKRNLTQEELEELPKHELVAMVIKLEAYNKQLKNILEKKVNPPKDVCKMKGSDRTLDFSKAHKRHILLKFCYLGWDYEGYVTQENTTETVEFYLFNALKKVCFIDDRESSNYNRCGRTDKGVSAFEQCISIDVRSKFEPSKQLTQEGIDEELGYCTLLNKVLPKQIRAICWQPLSTPTFSARFDCTGRTYKYFFPRGDLNVEKISLACKYLIGSHDFRNLCKMDVGNGVCTYTRRLDHVEVKMITKNSDNLEEFDFFCLEIKGSAFLWHMIRCIVAILMLVGIEKESPEIILELLDVEKNAKKPQYSLASEIPLNLFKCDYREDQPEDVDISTDEINTDLLNKWQFDETTLKDVIVDLQEHWCTHNVKSSMIYEMLRVLREEYETRFPNQPVVKSQVNSLNKDNKRREYQKLHDRQKCSTLEDRIDHFTKKRRIVQADDMDLPHTTNVNKC